MKRTYIFAGIILLIFLFGCSRYDDGPAISFRSAKNRVLGTWKVEKLLINDLDSTELYREQIGCEWEFTDELFSENSNDRYVFYYKNCPDDTVRRGLWYFYNTSNKISIETSSEIHPNHIGPIVRGGIWEIVRLTNEEMHLWINPPDNFVYGIPEDYTFYVELKKL
jgi:hypothetical protein